jgi:hypothetical protein
MKTPYRILAIVEGDGEERAVPVLLARWFRHRRFRNFETSPLAICAHGSGRLKCPYDRQRRRGIEHYVTIAAAGRPDGILVVLDADDECIGRVAGARPPLGLELRDRARAAAPQIPVEVVVANREYEAWFLAGVASLRRKGKLPRGQRLPEMSQVEAIRDCKGCLRQLMGKPYEPTIHQADLTTALPFTPGMAARSRSYRKLMKALEALVKAARAKRGAASRPP